LADFVFEKVNSNSQEDKTILRLHYSDLIETEIQLLKCHVDFLGIENFKTEWMEEYEIDLDDFDD
ncbi:MAG: hypothetical protein AAFY41_15635, partial [Bacteroidota bacterium]